MKKNVLYILCTYIEYTQIYIHLWMYIRHTLMQIHLWIYTGYCMNIHNMYIQTRSPYTSRYTKDVQYIFIVHKERYLLCIYSVYTHIHIHRMCGKYTHVYSVDIPCTYSALHLHISTIFNVCHLRINVCTQDMSYSLMYIHCIYIGYKNVYWV